MERGQPGRRAARQGCLTGRGGAGAVLDAVHGAQQALAAHTSRAAHPPATKAPGSGQRCLSAQRSRWRAAARPLPLEIMCRKEMKWRRTAGVSSCASPKSSSTSSSRSRRCGSAAPPLAPSSRWAPLPALPPPAARTRMLPARVAWRDLFGAQSRGHGSKSSAAAAWAHDRAPAGKDGPEGVASPGSRPCRPGSVQATAGAAHPGAGRCAQSCPAAASSGTCPPPGQRSAGTDGGQVCAASGRRLQRSAWAAKGCAPGTPGHPRVEAAAVSSGSAPRERMGSHPAQGGGGELRAAAAVCASTAAGPACKSGGRRCGAPVCSEGAVPG